jgi:hypothetical protein
MGLGKGEKTLYLCSWKWEVLREFRSKKREREREVREFRKHGLTNSILPAIQSHL